MKGVARRSRLSSAWFLLALLLLVVSCSSWHQTRALSDPAAREKQYTRLRMELVNGGVLTLHDPWFGGDTLYGRSETRVHDFGLEFEEGDTAAIPIAQIAKLEARRTNIAGTVLVALGVGVTALVAVVAIVCSSAPCFGAGDNCPRIESWDGTGWRLDSGTYAGAIMPALSRTDVDNLDFAQAQGRVLRLRLTGAAGETEHVDAIRLLVVDHDPRCTVAPDAGGTLHTLGTLTQPTAVRDFRRRDVLSLVCANDPLNWESMPTGRDTARAEDVRDGLEIEFPRAAGATEARLVVDGRYTVWKNYLTTELIGLHGRDTEAWYGALAADPAKARDFEAATARELFLEVSVWDGKGWRRQGFVPGVGPELPKRQVVRLDLSGVRGETVRVRLEAAPSVWLIDRVAIDCGPERDFVAKEIGPSVAFDTRGRDVRRQLDRADKELVVMESEDSVELHFVVDPTPSGRARSYLAATTGWYRLHTSESDEPNWALADRLIQEPRAMSRFSVSRFNEALHSMVVANY